MSWDHIYDRGEREDLSILAFMKDVKKDPILYTPDVNRFPHPRYNDFPFYLPTLLLGPSRSDLETGSCTYYKPVPMCEVLVIKKESGKIITQLDGVTINMKPGRSLGNAFKFESSRKRICILPRYD